MILIITLLFNTGLPALVYKIKNWERDIDINSRDREKKESLL